MRKGEQTRLRIIMKSAELFNRKGYAATTMQDIMDETGLTKGGLYRSFSGKDDIAVAAFQYAGEVLWRLFSQATENCETATEKIIAMCNVYSDTVNNPPLQGGCPFLNTAVEADHSFPLLRDHAIDAYGHTQSFMQGVLEQGVSAGEFQPDMDTEALASFIFSAIEGAIMASRLTRDNKHVAFATKQIESTLRSCART